MSFETSDPKYIICDSTKIMKPKAERVRKIKNKKDFWCYIPTKNLNLDLISLNEIENDFKEFKSKKEEQKVHKEISNLLIKAKMNKKNKKILICKRPEKPLYNNYQDIELFI